MSSDAYPHQVSGAKRLAESRALLLTDEAGTGKTRTTVMAADFARAERILVLCPAAVKSHWGREFARWQTSSRPIDIVDGTPKQAPGTGVTVCSHAAVVKKAGVWNLLQGGRFDAVVVDESHCFRNVGALRTQHLLGDFPFSLRRHTDRMWLLTGTPFVNSSVDFYPAVSGLFRPGEFTWWQFAESYAQIVTNVRGEVSPRGVKNLDRLRPLLKPHVLRRTLESAGIKLPPLTTRRADIPISDADLKPIMLALGGWSPARIDQFVSRAEEVEDNDLSRIRRAIGIAKVPAAAEVIDRAAKNGPVVAFFHHRDVLKLLHARLKDRWRVSWIDGSVTRPELAAAEDWFQTGRLDILLVQTQAGGMGLTLTAANQAIVVEPPWTAMALEQAIKRVHRITQTRPVDAQVLMASGCWLEGVMADAIGRKAAAAASIMQPFTTGA